MAVAPFPSVDDQLSPPCEFNRWALMGYPLTSKNRSMKKVAPYLLAIVGHLSIISILAYAVETENDPFSGQRREVSALAKLVDPPAMRDANVDGSTDELKAIYFVALDWQGKPTKVFAWLGVPKTIDGPLPAIVLVHGGGGTAFKEWVQKWNDHGFAAISIAVEGQTDDRDASNAWGNKKGQEPNRGIG